MKWVALMPLRGGSKSIPRKNTRSLAGRPLFAWSLEQAVLCECFDEIYVASDSEEIRALVKQEFAGAVEIIDRSTASATDTASTEIAMLEFQAQIAFDVLALIQATSPLTLATDFQAAKRKFIEEQLDSLLTGVENRSFLWTGDGSPLNYDPAKRPRRQDFDGAIAENGAFYYTHERVLTESKCRLAGRIGIHRMPAETAWEIDEESDWEIIEQLLQRRRSMKG